MTEYGGSSSYCTEEKEENSGCGAMFELVRSPKGTDYKMTLPWIFSLGDGAHPVTSLILDGGNLYGTTYNGGLGDFCSYPDGCGVAFEFTP